MFSKVSLRMKVMLAGLLLIGLVVASFFYLNRPGPLQAELQWWKAQGYPTNLFEWYAFYTPVPAPENAALFYQQAMSLGVQPFGNFATLPFLNGKPIVRPLDAETVKGFKEYIEANAQALEVLEKANTLERFRYPVDGARNAAFLMLPHLGRIKGIARLRTVIMEIAIHEKNGDEAVRQLERIAQSARHVTQEPILISQLVGFAILGIAVADLQVLLTELELNEVQINRLQKAFVLPELFHNARRGLAVETIMMTEVSKMSISELMQLEFVGGSFVDSRFLASAQWAGYKAFGGLPRDTAFGVHRLQEFYNVFEQMPQKAVLYEITDNIPRTYLISKMMLPAFGRYYKQVVVAKTNLDLAQVGLSIQLFRREHGKWPSELNELTPSLMTALPLDSFSGQSLNYKLDGEGYVVWSVGTNQLNDEGAMKPGQKDVTFRVKSEDPWEVKKKAARQK